ncbi:rod shape-determining protein MreD [Anabaena sp. FACHB-1237]|uniref:rod shape-determining protein MreD n=1 Tax=Anabaena sp. FACHB-1237 TaxID=2692769 RepID=UPI0016807CED|nr:rod shape-determining protein MreD [Anabaena sp. FACHB-1237]MBD2137488.1 rod shape-determining protein MreD [Anabaena sp. FACHB-1237]
MKIPRFSQNKYQKTRSLIPPLASWHPGWYPILDGLVIFASVLLCLLLLPTRFPGMELLGIGTNWLLIWVVCWSVNRSVLSGIFAGIILGLLQDTLTGADTSHTLSLGIVGMLTALIQKRRFIQEDFISIALIVFVMVILANTIFAVQLSSMGGVCGTNCHRDVSNIWLYYQRGALASAILTSLWAPVVYYPLNRWWKTIKILKGN